MNLLSNLFDVKVEFQKLTKQIKVPTAEYLSSNKHKEEREFFILGSFFVLMEAGGVQLPSLASKTDPPEPDFNLYSDDKKFLKRIEIVENLHHGRKRGVEYSNFNNQENDNLDRQLLNNVWDSLFRNLNQKFLKSYGDNTWLLMYHNIPVNHISQYGFWINIMFNAKMESVKRKEVDFGKCHFEKIFIINSNFEELICIYPVDEVIYSKYKDYCSSTALR